MAEKELTTKEKLFVEYYLGEARFNATQAMRLAKYVGNDNVLAVTASRLLRKPKIQELIQARVSEAAMTANEVLARLSDHARGSVASVMNDDNELDLDLAKKRKTDSLIKKIKIKRTSRIIREKTEDGSADETLETSILDEQIEFELHDAQAALVHLGRFHKIFTDRVEQSGTVNHDVTGEILLAIDQIYGDDDSDGESES